MNDETTLLSCPFCGGEATVERIGVSGYYYIACNTAYCCDFGKFDTEAEAIAAWNTRAELGSERIAELEAENERLRKAGYEIGYHDAMKAAKRGGTLTADRVREAIEEAEDELLESCEYVGGMGQRKGDVLKAFGKMEQAIAAALHVELGSGTCELVETDSYSDANEVIHVLECSECGKTCEHVNGSYPRCPHCGAKVVSA